MHEEGAPALSSEVNLVRVLGPVDLCVNGVDVDVPRVQVRRILGLLAAAPDHVLTIGRLIDELWPSDGPADPRKTLRVNMSRLRAVLGSAADALVSENEVYRLVGIESDLERFETVVHQLPGLDDPAELVARAEEALGWWRAEPFADAAGPALLDRVADEANDLRLVVIEHLGAALGSLGRFDRVVALLGGYVDAHPHRELLVVHYGRALAGVGRRGDALAALERTRVALRDRFGVDPGPEFMAAERDVLTGSMELARRARVGEDDAGAEATPVAGPHRGLLDRDHLVDRFADAIGTVGVSVVVGEAGIGKSAFVAACRTAALEFGSVVHLVAARESPRRPHEPLSALIDSVLADNSELESLHADVVARVFPDRASEPAGTGTVHTREALVEAAAELLMAGAPAERATILIDDAQWLDRVTHDVVARVVAGGRCRVLLASRNAKALEDLAVGSADQFVLSPLSTVSLQTLLEEVSPRMATHAAAEELARRSGGNPFFARMLVDLVAEGVDTKESLPPTVLLAVQQQLEDLPRKLRATLQSAAIAGGEFECGWLSKFHPDACEDLLDAQAAGMVRSEDGQTFVFVHLLMAEAIRELTPTGRLMDIHDQLGQGMAECGVSPVRYARHFAYAAPFDANRAVEALLASARSYMDAFDWAESLDHLLLAQGVQDEQHRPVDALAVAVMLEHGRVLRTLRDETSADVLFDAANAAIGLDDQLFAGAVVELCSHGQTLASGAVNPDARTLLGRALSLDLPPAERARVCAAATALLALSNEHELSRSLYREALDLVDAAVDEGRLDDAALDRLQGDVYTHAHVGLGHPDDLVVRSQVAAKLARLGRSNPELAWEAAFIRSQVAMVEADGATLVGELARLRELTPFVPGRPRDFGLSLVEVGALVFAGDLEGAEEAATVALAIGMSSYPESWVATIYGSLVMGIRVEQGRLAEFRGIAQQWVTDSPEFMTWQVLAAATCVADNDASAGRAWWDHIRRDRFGGIVGDLTWTAAMRLVGELAVAFEDDEACAAAFELLTPHAGRMHFGGACTYGPVDTTLALLADHLRQPDVAARYRDSATKLR